MADAVAHKLGSPRARLAALTTRGAAGLRRRDVIAALAVDAFCRRPAPSTIRSTACGLGGWFPSRRFAGEVRGSDGGLRLGTGSAP